MTKRVAVRTTLLLTVAALVAAPAGAARGRDRTPPTVRIATEDDAILLSATDVLEGSVSDKGRVRNVRVSYVACRLGDYGGEGVVCGNGFGPRAAGGWWDSPNSYACTHAGGCEDVPAALTTCNKARTLCRWRAPLPAYPGVYAAVVDAFDRAGNEGGDVVGILVI